MIKIIVENQIGAFGPMDIILDNEEVFVAVDVRDYNGIITPQYADAAVLLLGPDDFAWAFGGAERPEYYGYVKPFASYADYCGWLNTNLEI